MVSGVFTPTRASVSRRCRSSTPPTALPSKLIITSPSRIPACLRQVIETYNPAVKGNGLRRDANIATADAAFRQKAAGDEFRGVNSDCEAKTLRAHDRRGIHAHNRAVRGNEWPARVARVQR